MITHQCDICKALTKHPTLQIKRTDQFSGGGGVRVFANRPWDLCEECSRALDGALGQLVEERGPAE